ncbi:hypothetical protein C8R43DRAFT_359408 [Mycena crocata]|nr:hypothetical protein C8R43DRAFT_359408 [Mycena crocata]
MQFKAVLFIAALFTVASASDCVTIIKNSVCPVGYFECGPLQVGQTKCCPVSCIDSYKPWKWIFIRYRTVQSAFFDTKFVYLRSTNEGIELQ